MNNPLIPRKGLIFLCQWVSLSQAMIFTCCNSSNSKKEACKKMGLKQDLNPYLPDNSWGPITYWATKLHIRSGVHLRGFFLSNGGIWSQSCPSLRHLFNNSLNCTWPMKAIAFLDFNQKVKCNNSFRVVSKFYIWATNFSYQL